MTHSVNSSKYTAIYRCWDDITNLRIKIRFKELENEDYEDFVFKWQEKIFSKTEKDYYENEKNCVTDLEKKYHNDVVKLEMSGKFDLFSYINDDDFVIKEENWVISDYDEEFDFVKSVTTAMQNPKSYNYDFEVMFIMADLGDYVDNIWIKNEKTLCTIKYDKKHKILSICPDFSKFEPYCIEIESQTTKKYEYKIENVSEVMDEESQLKEQELIKKLVARPTIDLPFCLPEKNQLQVHLLIEILSTKLFEYDTIYVQYFIDLPSDWFCTDESQLQGVTQTCYAKGEEKIAHVSHLIDVTFNYNIENLNNTKIPKSPYIYLEVVSKDSWNRYRTEGLTYKNLPLSKPGKYQYDLQCFRLIPDSISGQLRRFFIGDCSSYNDITWIGLPKNYESPFLNKYGTNTVGTGLVSLRINVIQQSQAFMDQNNGESIERREIFEKLNNSSLVKSVEQVLLAFKRARKNMLEVRKNL